MEETIATILYGCKLGREVEANLANWGNQRGVLLSKTEEIIAVFNNVRERLISQQQQQQQQQAVQEWLSSSGQLVHAADNMLDHGGTAAATTAYAVHGLPQENDQMDGGRSSTMVPMDATHDSSRAASSSSQRQRTRTRDADRRIVRASAPRMGNLELPPEDGFTWRKYGQKEILGSRFPRAYYRCTHQKLYHCPAKKQVQRLDDDPYVFEVTYRSQHTCYMSATAPTVPLPLVEEITHQTTTTPPPAPLLLPPPTSASLSGHWLSMDIKPQIDQAGTTYTSTPFDIQRDFGQGSVGSLASICNVVTAGSSGSGGAGPSGSRFGREVDYQPVVDMADAMFNSGSSSNTSMDIIFSSMDDKWDTAEKKE